ncbi:MAG: ATP-binding protein [candidate division NC10 bacterium]
MIIMLGVNRLHTPFIPRLLTATVEEALGQFPVVVLTGARQTGKSTLVQHLPSAHGRLYRTLDDFDVLARAERFPETLLEEGDRVTLDEVQRAPQLLLAIKRAVDRDRRKGRFLLTGSANLLLMRKVSESLAGRAIYLTLLPMTEREKRRSPDPGPWSRLLEADTPKALARALGGNGAPRADWAERALIGGYPSVVLAGSPRERVRWFEGYVRTYLERDLQELASIGGLADFRRLMKLTALRLGQILNQSELGRDAALSQPTVHRYLNLLETSYQIVRVPAFARSRSSRLIKSPKVYWGDTGLAAFLTELSDAGELRRGASAGGLLENLVLTQLLAWREVELPRPQVYYWRTAAGAEVDFVIESKSRLLPVEVKATPRARLEEARSLESFLDEHPRSARVGLLLYGGNEVIPLSPRVLAAPVGAVL